MQSYILQRNDKSKKLGSIACESESRIYKKGDVNMNIMIGKKSQIRYKESVQQWRVFDNIG